MRRAARAAPWPLALADSPQADAYRQLARARRLEAEAYERLAELADVTERERAAEPPAPVSPELPLWLTVQAYAAQTGQNAATVRAAIRAGRLAARRFGPGTVRIPRAALEAEA